MNIEARVNAEIKLRRRIAELEAEVSHWKEMDALHIQSLGLSQAENAEYKKSVDMNYLSGLDAANKKQAFEIERLNLELQKRDKCSYMGPMRDCPTHGDRDAKRLRWLLEYWWFGNNSGVDFGSALTEDEVRATIDAAMLKTPNVELTGAEPKAERPC